MSLTPKVPALRRPLCLRSAADLLGVAHGHVDSTLKVPVPGRTWHRGLQLCCRRRRARLSEGADDTAKAVVRDERLAL